MRDKLHKEIDLREELQEWAAESVKSFIQERLADALDQSRDETTDEINCEEAMSLLAQWYEDEVLTDLTTEAVQRGAKAASDIYGHG